MDRTATETPRNWMTSVIGWPNRLYQWVLAWADSPHALWALFILSFAEASFFPIPPDVLLIAMCLGAQRRSLRFAGLCTLASIIGGIAGYGIGAFLWGQLDQWFFDYIPGFTPERFEEVRALYSEYGILIVFTAGFTPIPYKIFTIASGVMGLALVPFVIASAVGRGARFFLVAALIYRFGQPVRNFIDRYLNVLTLVFTVLLVGGFVLVRWLL